MQPELGDEAAPLHQLRFEVIDLVVGALPFGGLRETLDALHQDAAVPGAVEDHDLPLGRHITPEAPQVVVAPLLLGRSRDGDHREVTSFQSAGDATDDATLAGGVPPLERQHCGDPLFAGLDGQPMQAGLLFGQFLAIVGLVEALGEVHPGQDIRLAVEITEDGRCHRRAGVSLLLEPRGERRQDRPRDGQVAVAIISGFHDRPRRTRSACLAQNPLGDRQHRSHLVQRRPVTGVDLPTSIRVLLGLLELLALLLRGRVQEELQHQGTVGDQLLLHGGDVVEPLAEVRLTDLAIRAHRSGSHQTAREDRRTALLRDGTPQPPQLGSRRLFLGQIQEHPRAGVTGIHPLVESVDHFVGRDPVVARDPDDDREVGVPQVVLGVDQTQPKIRNGLLELRLADRVSDLCNFQHACPFTVRSEYRSDRKGMPGIRTRQTHSALSGRR